MQKCRRDNCMEIIKICEHTWSNAIVAYKSIISCIANRKLIKKNKNIKLDDSKWIKINDVDEYAFSNVNHKLIQLMRDKKND